MGERKGNFGLFQSHLYRTIGESFSDAGGSIMEKYCIGIDFGTLSGRALLVRLNDGKEMAVAVMDYPHGVMMESLPSGKSLPANFALQHPGDYLIVLEHIVPDVLNKTGIKPHQILGLGIAVTSSTILPVTEDGTPLCLLPDYHDESHSWVKLWKHHGAQKEALELNRFLETHYPDLAIQFGASSAERLLPKVLEVKRQSPKVYQYTYAFIEVADWLTWQLTGKLQRSAPIAGYKAMWRKETGYLTAELLAEIDDDYREIIPTKLKGDIIPLGRAGQITPKMANTLGLSPKTVIATGYIDAHASALGAGVCKPGNLAMVMGTTACHMLMDEKLELVEGMSGAVQDGIIPGFYGYEGGQAAVGDLFQWYVDRALPKEYWDKAISSELNSYDYLEKLATEIPFGQSGLLALDWWNGNRSILNNANLSGLILGLTTQTKPEEIYLALLESTAFGARRIMESFQEKNLKVDSITVCGGLPRKNELLMEIYANVTNRTIEVASSKFTSALGMAIVAAVAVGEGAGGYDDLREATEKMTKKPLKSYHPKPDIAQIYECLYGEYKKLHDYFGKDATQIMESLRKLKVRGDGNLPD